MNYIYDIYANLSKKYYEIYDWIKQDKIIHIKKVPIFKIQNKDLKTFINHDIIIDKSLFKLIKNKSELFNISKKMTLCIFTDDKNFLLAQINKEGKIIKKSSIYFTNNFSGFVTIKNLKLIDLKYLISNKNKISFLNRADEEKKHFLLKQINKLDNNKLSYLYFECFEKKSNNTLFIKKTLKKDVIDNNEKTCSIIYNFLKLIYAY